uniref:L-selectin n=1 Tax=Anas platyrhynchos platyrhynchos TaxID=8840 RepID=A0A493SY76_ANAPP
LPCTRARYGEVPCAEGSFPWLVPLGHAESWQDRAKGVEAWTYSYSDPGLYSWEQARNYCRTFFTDLVAIQNKEEIAYLNATLPFLRQYYWIGIRKQGGVWTWVGTNKVLTKEAENWARGEPNNRRSNQDCVEIYIKRQQEAGKWNDEPCNKKKTALCYKASCQASTCRPHGECVEVIKSYRCECHPGFEGDDCSIGECLAGSAGGQGAPPGWHRAAQPLPAAGCGPKSPPPLLLSPSEGFAVCLPAVQCPTLDAQGALMTCSHPFGDFRYNSTCDFGCPEGFERRGEGTLRCLASRQWSAETPTCAGRDHSGLGLRCGTDAQHPLFLPAGCMYAGFFFPFFLQRIR